MDKKIIIISVAVLLVGLIVAGYFYWSAVKKPQEETANLLQELASTTQQAVQKATQGALPSLGANPMENKPDLNPVDKANPIKDIKINPFD
ncbi:MAG: hypothetical protein Q7R99_02800 [bacterium]|nr:hypothetical protein [bacterium]